MNIQTIPYVQAFKPSDYVDQTIIVIDTFRATSTIVAALSSGVKCVIPVKEIEDAKKLWKPGRILAGERFGAQIEEFSLGNSPVHFIQDSSCKGKELILTTTNGTRALSRVAQAKRVWIGSLLNARSIAQRLHIENISNVLFYCAGTRGTMSFEDCVTVGAILEEWRQLDSQITQSPSPFDDLSLLCMSSFQFLHSQDQLHLLRESRAGKRNHSLGNEEDLDLCLKINEFNVVPTYAHGVITASIF
ncbi:2-phosphosulfolactate phosphatase [Thermoactinomyces sp. DSM 45892]|uniref:2-phosphosulfolactate phosphatase n=1 Tax=Thermoactinomyces sp. DSM 45892 TaxID=1882753 RepID=UPI00089CFEE5|nr:2-phosphosulfolactate phosphatase [Thermoactinomyces sp. DSM 45892]SDY00333.1 2-phosphosulfolactate phosphatase [Thermoactinomyces sp. DSM 45892]